MMSQEPVKKIVPGNIDFFQIDLIKSCFYKCISDQLAQWNLEIQHYVEINSLSCKLRKHPNRVHFGKIHFGEIYTLEKYNSEINMDISLKSIVAIIHFRALTPYTREALRPPYTPRSIYAFLQPQISVCIPLRPSAQAVYKLASGCRGFFQFLRNFWFQRI